MDDADRIARDVVAYTKEEFDTVADRFTLTVLRMRDTSKDGAVIIAALRIAAGVAGWR